MEAVMKMDNDSRRAISSLDTDELNKFGIRCNNFPGSDYNTIFVSENMHSRRGLEINFSGAGNEVDLRGSHMPAGILSIQGGSSSVAIDSDGEIVLHAYIYDGARLIIQKPRALFGLWVSIFADTCLSIAPGCLFAEGVKIYTSDHHSIIDLDKECQTNFPGDVSIERDVWVAGDVTILKRSTIGKGSIIGARSVVSAEVPPYELWGGQPARSLRKRVSWVASHPADPTDITQMLASVEPS
jgi:acetyltransferase-like isoleucine patch superfamily enzyme